MSRLSVWCHLGAGDVAFHKTQRYGANFLNFPVDILLPRWNLSFKINQKIFPSPSLATKMAITHQQAEAIRNWIPFPSAPSPPSPVASPSREKFLVRPDSTVVKNDINDSVKCNWPGSPTPSDSVSEVFWARAGLSCLSNDDLAEG